MKDVVEEVGWKRMARSASLLLHHQLSLRLSPQYRKTCSSLLDLLQAMRTNIRPLSIN